MGRAATMKPLPFDGEGYAYDELRPLVELTLRAGTSVLLRGHPGVGKSTLAAETAAAMALPMIDIRLAQRDPAELAGVHFPDRERGVLSLFPPEWVRDACESPVMVFLDEVNAAVTRLHQAAAYQIVLERRVGPFQFHPGTVVMAAGNLEEDSAIVTPLSSALCNRFAHYTLRADVATWLAWGARNGIDEAILAFIGRHGDEMLYRHDGEPAFPTPRSWEMASRVLTAVDPSLRKRAVASCVGSAAAEKLEAYLRIYRRVNATKILQSGRAMDFRRGKAADPSFIYAAVFAVAACLKREVSLREEEMPNVVRFLRSPGLDPEFVFLFLRQLRDDRDLLDRLKPLPEYRTLAGELVDLRTGLQS